MAELKTKRTDESVTAVLDRAVEESRRPDCVSLIELLKASVARQKQA